MRYSFACNIAALIADIEGRVSESEPSEQEMRKLGFVLVHRKTGDHYRKLPLRHQARRVMCPN